LKPILSSLLLQTITLVLAGPAAAQSHLHDWPPPAVTGALNPEVTPATIKDTICKSGWTQTVRAPASFTTMLKLTQMQALGYSEPNPLPRIKTKSGKGTRPDLRKCTARSATPACWEEDHLIALELGGNPTDPTNLWPEPWNGSYSAHEKDALENTLKRLVCAGDLPLADAQQAIRTDWVKAYLQYVVTK
jgi:hypothetical protein